MSFGGLILTNKGRNLQAKAQIGAKLNFTRIALGDGEIGGSSILDLNALKREVKSLSIIKFSTLPGGKAVCGGYLSNQDMIEGFYWRELGLFAMDPDLGEILYCYGNAGINAEYIPAGGGAHAVEKHVDVVSIIGNAANVSAVIESSLVWETVIESQEKANTALTAAKDYTDQEIGGKTIDDTLVPSTDTGLSVKILLSWLANMIKGITGKASWRIKPTKNMEELNTTITTHMAELATQDEAGHIKLSDIPTSLPANGGNSDTLMGLYPQHFVARQTVRNFTHGTLIKTDWDYDQYSNIAFLLKIEANAYGELIPIDTIVQGYLYNGTILNYGGISSGTPIKGLVAFNMNNKLCFWFPSQGYWHGYNIHLANVTFANNNLNFSNINCEILDASKPLNISAEINLSNSIPNNFNRANYGNVLGTSVSIDLTNDLHCNSVIYCPNTSNITITVPVDATQPFPIGTQITVIRTGAGEVTFVPASGTIILSKDTKRGIDGQYASATLIKILADQWILIGALK